MGKKLILTLPDELSDLEAAAVALYNDAPRNSKSRRVLDLIVGGMILKDMGLLEYVVGLRSAQEMICDGQPDQKQGLKREIFKTVDSAVPTSEGRRNEPQEPITVPQEEKKESFSDSLEAEKESVAASFSAEEVKKAPEPVPAPTAPPARQPSVSTGPAIKRPASQPPAFGSMMQIQTGAGDE